MVKVINVQTGSVTVVHGETELSKLKENGEGYLLDKETGKEFNKNSSFDEDTVLFYYDSKPAQSTTSTTTTAATTSADDSSLDTVELVRTSTERGNKLLGDAYRQQGLQLLCNKHLIQHELPRYKKVVSEITAMLDKLQHFVATTAPHGVEPLLQKLSKTKCLTDENRSVLDVLCETTPDLVKLLNADYSAVKTKLDGRGPYTSILSVAVTTSEDNIMSLRSQIGSIEDIDDLVNEVSMILEQQKGVLNEVSKYEQLLQSSIDGLASLDAMNHEIIYHDKVVNNDRRLRELQSEFKLKVQNTLGMNTPDDIYNDLLKWKRRVATFISSLTNTVSEQSYVASMNNISFISALTEVYEKAKEEVKRRKTVHSALDKECTTFYQALKLAVSQEEELRSRFRTYLDSQTNSALLHRALDHLMGTIGLGEEYDIIELLESSHYMLRKPRQFQNLTDNIVRDHDWEEIDDYDFMESPQMTEETPEIDIAKDFGTESVFFTKAINQLNIVNSPVPQQHQEIVTPTSPQSVSSQSSETTTPPQQSKLSQSTDENATIIRVLKERIEQLENDNIDMRAALSASEKQRLALEAEFAKQEERRSAESETYKSSINELTSELNQRNVLVSTLENELSEMTFLAETLKKQLQLTEGNMKASNVAYEKKIKAYEIELEKSKKENEHTSSLLNQAKADFNDALANSSSSSSKLMEQVEKIQMERSESLKENALLQDKIEQYEQELSQQKHNSAQLKEEISIIREKSTSEIDSLTQELNQLKQQMELLKQEQQEQEQQQKQAPATVDNTAQERIKELQSIVQRSALMVNEYMNKSAALEKIKQSLAVNMVIAQKDIGQLQKRIQSLKDNSTESNLCLRGVNLVSQIGCLKMCVQAISECLVASFSAADEQGLEQQQGIFTSNFEAMTDALNDLNEVLLELFQIQQVESSSSQQHQQQDEDRQANRDGPSDLTVALNNFRDDSRLLFFRSGKNREVFEAFNINCPGYYLSPDSVQILKNKYGAHYPSTFYCVGKVVFMEEAEGDVLRLQSSQPYTLVTVTFEEE